jgi:hypothetical protein
MKKEEQPGRGNDEKDGGDDGAILKLMCWMAITRSRDPTMLWISARKWIDPNL